MTYNERNANMAQGGYGSLVWVNDDKGREFSCTVGGGRGNVKSFDELTDEEKKTCMDVSQIVGTERW